MGNNLEPDAVAASSWVHSYNNFLKRFAVEHNVSALQLKECLVRHRLASFVAADQPRFFMSLMGDFENEMRQRDELPQSVVEGSYFCPAVPAEVARKFITITDYSEYLLCKHFSVSQLGLWYGMVLLFARDLQMNGMSSAQLTRLVEDSFLSGILLLQYKEMDTEVHVILL